MTISAHSRINIDVYSYLKNLFRVKMVLNLFWLIFYWHILFIEKGKHDKTQNRKEKKNEDNKMPVKKLKIMQILTLSL